jgi:Gas vesicle synthesis protein GvpL/GvpF/DnaJ domain
MTNDIYIYGIIKTSDPQEFGEIGIGNGTVSAVRTIGFKDLAAVVSNSPLMTFDSKEKVMKDLAIHQAVIEKVMKEFTIIPVKFGTMVKTEDEAVQFLEKGYVLLNNELARIEGKIELDVVAWWELQKILDAISHHNSQIQEKRQELAGKGEKVSTEEKVSLGQSIEQALNEEKARCHQLILQTLKQEAEDVCPHDLANDEMIYNAAFLLEKTKEASFYTAVDTLDAKLAQDERLEKTVNFRVVGPLPPYSFATILVTRIDPDKIEEAKKTLGLAGEIDDKTLRDTYHQLIKEYHPDKTGVEESTEFQHLHDANNTLSNFIEHGSIYPEVYRWKQEQDVQG